MLHKSRSSKCNCTSKEAFRPFLPSPLKILICLFIHLLLSINKKYNANLMYMNLTHYQNVVQQSIFGANLMHYAHIQNLIMQYLINTM